MLWPRSDRIAYPSHDSRTVPAEAAGATSRTGLATNILLGPAYPPTLLAKATASLASRSGSRFTLGLPPGNGQCVSVSSPLRAPSVHRRLSDSSVEERSRRLTADAGRCSPSGSTSRDLNPVRRRQASPCRG